MEAAVAVAQDRGTDFVCGTFMVPGRRDRKPTAACFVSDRGIVAVIAFDEEPDWRFLVTGPLITGEIPIPVDRTDVYGFETTTSGLSLAIESRDTVIGTLGFARS